MEDAALGKRAGNEVAELRKELNKLIMKHGEL